MSNLTSFSVMDGITNPLPYSTANVSEVCRVIPVGTSIVDILTPLKDRAEAKVDQFGGRTLTGLYTKTWGDMVGPSTNWFAHYSTNVQTYSSNSLAFAAATNLVQMVGTNAVDNDPWVFSCSVCAALLPWWEEPMDLKPSRRWPRFMWWFRHILIWGADCWLVCAGYVIIREGLERLPNTRQAQPSGQNALVWVTNWNLIAAQAAAFLLTSLVILFPIFCLQFMWGNFEFLSAFASTIAANPVSLESAAGGVTAGVTEFVVGPFAVGCMVFDELVPWVELLGVGITYFFYRMFGLVTFMTIQTAMRHVTP